MRSEVPVELTWRLEDIFATQADWDQELAAVEALVPEVEAFKGRLDEGAGTLLACLEARERLQERLDRLVSYASLRNSEEGTSHHNQGLVAQAGALAARVGAALSFIPSEITALADGVVERFLAAEPRLEVYRHYLHGLLVAKPHRFSAETETVLAALRRTLESAELIHNRAKISDMQFPPVVDHEGREIPMSFGSSYRLLSSTDREMRRRAWESMTKGLSAYKTTFATTLATQIERNVTLAKLRGYRSAEEMLLAPQQVPLEVYNNVLDVILAEVAPHVRRYMELRRRVLGVDRVERYDMNAPLDPEFNPTTTYQEASELIQRALSVLGPEYSEILRQAFSERWIDLADNVGKGTGAFCHPVYGVHAYVLITWADRMRTAFVLAHELGHVGHMALTAKYQRKVNSDWDLFSVETPSTANELILGYHILDNTTDARMRRWVIMQFLGTFMHNMVTHLLEGELERRLYRIAEAGRPLTVKTICDEQADVFAKFYGGTVAVDEGARLNWMLVPHLYVGLYPYTYAAGLSAACSVVEAIRTEGQPAVERWLGALKLGGSKYPLEMLAAAGVDMRSTDPLRKATATFGRLVEELERSYN